MTSTAAGGIAAALASPLVSTVGFVVWQNHWTGSAFALNLYKCGLASVAFGAVVLLSAAAGNSHAVRRQSTEIFTRRAVGYLILSSTLGIVIGDVLWLQALLILGARRVIVVDSLKPFLAALFGRLVLGEAIHAAAAAGIAITVAGVLLVSLEREEGDDGDDGSGAKLESATMASEVELIVVADLVGGGSSFGVAGDEGRPQAASASSPNGVVSNDPSHPKVKQKRIASGYAMSLVNVALDTYGSVLTKQYGRDMTVWEINLIRFGFAGAVMLVVSVVLSLGSRRQRPRESGVTDATEDSTSLSAVDPELFGSATMAAAAAAASHCPPNVLSPTPWYAIPFTEMTRSSWLHVSAGVALVTFLSPTLSNYALFQITLALTLTLTSVGPLYALPLSYWMVTASRRRLPSLRAMVGAVLAVAGIAVLAFWGTTTVAN